MLGNNIKELRKLKRMTQKDLAEAMKVSQQTIGAWETERAVPGADTLNELADYFNVTTDYLLGRPEKKDGDTKPAAVDDLDKMIDNARSFGGKQMTENDREIIKAYLKGFYDNKNQGK
ncbi:XRE family transcriptional regulator [Ligilactobacillus agilis]|uniref:XRE family transcriptional regulator n=2 Tax=Ligilactobacillus agilis TaxID=1601 RepID=A0A6F9Y2N6_9LACO|nr:helix-turn-helix transcriptional regulator [Ligilactobacillus agilis]GET11655.1 XRE family transcriptional regulator [Ligilactobacillus agilis]